MRPRQVLAAPAPRDDEGQALCASVLPPGKHQGSDEVFESVITLCDTMSIAIKVYVRLS